MQNISRENADIIGEVANICIGNAATTLSMILQKPTNITTPIVEVLKKEDALDHDDRILIKVPYTKGLDGTNLLIIKLNDALVIANLMMGGNGSNVSDMTFVTVQYIHSCARLSIALSSRITFACSIRKALLSAPAMISSAYSSAMTDIFSSSCSS